MLLAGVVVVMISTIIWEIMMECTVVVMRLKNKAKIKKEQNSKHRKMVNQTKPESMG